MICCSPYYHEVAKGKRILLPCRKCIPCKIQYCDEWATRVMHESTSHKHNSFITLTYSDFYNPYELDKKVLQKFIKRLRKNLKSPLKYFACGEYGSKGQIYNIYGDLGRPHYHVVLFGFDCFNKKHIEALKKSWTFCDYDILSMSKIAEPLNYQRARYTAQYVMKKYNNDMKEEIYGDYQQPFLLMSRGLGKDYFLENIDKIMAQGFVYTDGSARRSIPRYYLDLVDKILDGDIMELADSEYVWKFGLEHTIQKVRNARLKDKKISDKYGSSIKYACSLAEFHQAQDKFFNRHSEV